MALAIDGSAHGTGIVSAACVATLTTTNAGDIIMVVVTLNHGPLVSVASANLTFTRYGRQTLVNNGSGDPTYLDIWSAVAAGALTSEVITATQSGIDYITMDAFGVSGANTSSPFDSNASLPAVMPGLGSDVVLSTTSANTLVFCGYRMGATANPTAGSGFTTLHGSDNQLVEYKIVAAAQTNLDCTLTVGSGDMNGGVGGAIVQASGGVTGTAAWTEAKDIWAGAGGVQDNGTAAWIEAKDIWAGAGGVLVSGTAAWTEAADTWAGVGTVLVSGAAAWTEAQDTWAGAGTVASGITGTAAWVEAQDTWAGAGAVLVSGAAAWIEQQDIWSGTGSVTLPAITGTAAWTEAPDRWSGQGTNGLLIDYDTGKRKKRADKRRDKAIAEERAKNERRRQQMLDAFERTFEGKIDLPEPVLQEMVKAAEKHENIPNGPNFEAILANLSNIEALWREYLDKDDEEVLLLL